MTRVDGIAETISDCLTPRGIELPADVLNQLAEDIDHGIQCWNEMSYGHIPNPMIAEVEKAKKHTKQAEAAHDRDMDRWRRTEDELRREIRSLRWRLEDAYNKGFRE